MDPSRQRGMLPQMQQIFIPIVSAGSRPTIQHVMVPSGTVMAPGTTFAIPHAPIQSQSIPTATIEPPPPPPPPPPPVELYLCDSTKSATDLHSETSGEQVGEKASLNALERSYQELNSRIVKDSLSSFLPDIPGEFDSAEPMPDTMLKGLVDRPPIGGKEFLPLSGQALLGFRLLPGVPLPEQYRLDPPSAAPKHHHRKRKHKHKTIDKLDDGRESSPMPPAHSTKIPSDAYSFITVPPMPPSHPHHLPTQPGMAVSVTQKTVTGSHLYQANFGATPGITGPPQTLGGVDPPRISEKKRKKKKDRDKDKEKRKKEKKKKREKHHSQDPALVTHSHTVPPPLISHPPPPPFTQHPHPPT